MRRIVVAAVLASVLAATPGALGKPIVGVTGNTARFKAQTAQTSSVVQAFLGWGQGQGYGAPFPVLLRAARHWQLVFGDGLAHEGNGTPPRFAGHTFEKPGSYRVLLIVDEAPFAGTLVRLVATTTVKVS